jgi:hypothetical protein
MRNVSILYRLLFTLSFGTPDTWWHLEYLIGVC